MGSNLVYDIIQTKTNYFETLLAALSITTWFKLILKMQMTRKFGPTFKAILAMMGDLVMFYMLWLIILCTLTSIACLLFMDIPDYQSFFGALYMHFEWGLGNFDSSIFCPE